MLKTNKNTTIFRLCEEEKKKRCVQRLTVFQRPPARDDRRAPLEVRVGRQADGSDVVLPHQSLFERYQSDVVLLWRFGCLLALVEKLVVYWRAHLRNYILREESNEIYVTIYYRWYGNRIINTIIYNVPSLSERRGWSIGVKLKVTSNICWEAYMNNLSTIQCLHTLCKMNQLLDI